jgi:uncharacterized caspase-like protein
MVKVALLIGVSEYEPGLAPLPAAVKDVEEMRRVLEHPAIGSFDEVRTLPNPDPLVMQEAIETLFSGLTKDDLVLLFFSGHGIKDDSGRLYWATRITRKNPKGELVKATAVPASFVHDIMNNSRSRRQVVILDCCFSGAFAVGLSAKDDGSVDVKNQLGGEGRAVLTSSTSTEYSFEQQGADLSIYTRYIVEGIESGAADIDSDGAISVDELHEYAKGKVQQIAPAMKPEIYAVKQGYKIHLAKASMDDPKLRYRKEVERCASRGEISLIGRRILDDLRDSFRLPPEEAAAIEVEVLAPIQEYNKRLQRYEQALFEATKHEYPLSRYAHDELKRYQNILGLRDEDIAPIEDRIIPKKEVVSSPEKVVESNEAQSISHCQDVVLTDRLNQEAAGNKTVTLTSTDSVSSQRDSHQPNSITDLAESIHTAPDLSHRNSQSRSGCQVQLVVAGIAILVLTIGGLSYFTSPRSYIKSMPSPTLTPNTIDFGVLNNYEIRIYYRKNRADLAGDAQGIQKKFTESGFKGKIQLYAEDDSFFKKLNYPSTNPPAYEIRYDKNEAVAADRLEKILEEFYHSKQFKKLDIGYISENSMSIFLGS